MLEGLGKELRAVRKLRERSLQAVAGSAKISVAYLQKLENGTVNDPSPRVLRRLAGALEVPYYRLMELAGYLDPDQEERRLPSPVPWVLAGEELSAAEWKAVAAFVRYLKEQRDETHPDEPESGEETG